MKTGFKSFFRAAALLGLACVAGLWFFGRVPANSEGHVGGSIAPGQGIVAHFTARKKTHALSTNSNLLSARRADSIAMAPPSKDPDEAREWARRSPAEALEWLTNAPASEQRDIVAEIVCANVAQLDPAQAVSLAERFSGGNGSLLENLVQQWAERNEPDAFVYATNRPPGDERDHLLNRVAFAQSLENPREAAKLVVEQMAPGEIQNEAAISVLHQWALRDPDTALAWAQSFSDQRLRARALMEVENLVPKPSGQTGGNHPRL